MNERMCWCVCVYNRCATRRVLYVSISYAICRVFERETETEREKEGKKEKDEVEALKFEEENRSRSSNNQEIKQM